jgi:hypothetical protein
MKIMKNPNNSLQCPNIFQNLVEKSEFFRKTRALKIRFFILLQYEIRLYERQVSFKEKEILFL